MPRALPLLLALAATALPAADTRAQGAAPGETADADAAAEAAERAAEAALEAELAEETERPSLVLGPARRGRPTVAADVGWVRSGLRFELGIARRVDLVARVDAMLLYDFLSGQNGVQFGARVTPIARDRFRLSAEGTIGQVFSPGESRRGNLTVGRAELTAGYGVGPATVFARFAARALRIGAVAGSGFTHDEELGGGLEGRWRRLMAAAEGYVILRPRLDALPQWRLRVGIAL